MDIRTSPLRAWMLAAAMLVVAWLPTAVVGVALVLAGLAWAPHAVVLVPLTLFVAGFVSGAMRRERLPGKALRPDDEPELAALVRGVAGRVGFREPLLVRVVPTVDASLAPTRAAGGRAYTLLLGHPLLRMLSADQLASVVAHELAHAQHLRDRRTAALRLARHVLADRMDRRFRPLAALAAPLLRASQPPMWQAELAADADAARVTGSAATAQALRRTGLLHEAFEGLGSTWWSALAEEDTYPVDFYDALETAVRDPYVAARAARGVAEDDAVDPYATADHPPAEQRLAALPPDAVAAAAYGAEPVTLRAAASIERWCLGRLAGLDDPDLDDEPRPVRLLDMAPDQLHDLGDETGKDLLLLATGEESPERALSAALDALADGTWPRLAGLLEPGLRRMPAAARTTVAHAVLTAALAQTLHAVLRPAGWTRAHRWLATVLTTPDGTVTDLHELAAQAVRAGDPAPLRALLTAAAKTRKEAAA
ncbi:M48 family metallopeptidase [Streptomyces sp. TRM70350]|uniref:M48 family metallopeptidase n=1 Tax=Streptomyces sp. TRM70350 TaxID=2856165 RepID=UPI001C47F7EB|nr:M48 family metallopeptidase [Streptomyces sp. TRM70350]MBV7697094.1 M48 family metallopeptidase [Streptomyces sp. TRM70350]